MHPSPASRATSTSRDCISHVIGFSRSNALQPFQRVWPFTKRLSLARGCVLRLHCTTAAAEVLRVPIHPVSFESLIFLTASGATLADIFGSNSPLHLSSPTLLSSYPFCKSRQRTAPLGAPRWIFWTAQRPLSQTPSEAALPHTFRVQNNFCTTW